MKVKNVLLVCIETHSKENNKAIRYVKSTLKKYNIKFSTSKRNNLKKSYFLNKDLIIAVGGDGTFLKASHFIVNSMPIFGVNSDPENKEGFFMRSDISNFEKKFSSILKGKYRIKKIRTLEAKINGKKLPINAVNEFYVGAIKSYITSRYEITIGNKKEKQRSSGVIIATSSGSRAWASSARGPSVNLQDKFLYVVREPYERRLFKNYKLKSGILNSSSKIRLTSNMHRGVVVADSLSNESIIKTNDKVEVKLSKNYVSMIEL